MVFSAGFRGFMHIQNRRNPTNEMLVTILIQGGKLIG